MQTIGTKAGEKHRGDFIATCFYCGAAWYRSELRRNAAGQLICPDDRHIRDPVTLDRLNARALSRVRRGKADGGIADTDGSPAVGPLAICPELLVAGWDAASGVTMDSFGLAETWVDVVGGVELARPHAGVQKPKIKTTGPNGRTYLAFEGNHAFAAPSTFTRPAPSSEPTFYWAVVSRPRWKAAASWWNFATTALAVAETGGVIPEFTWQTHASGVNTVSMPMGPFRRVEALFSASTSDYLKIGKEVASGESAGDGVAAANFLVGAGSVSGVFAWLNVAALWVMRAAPSADQLVRLDDYANSKFGGDVLL